MRNKKSSSKSSLNFKTGALFGVPVVLLALGAGIWFFSKSDKPEPPRVPANAAGHSTPENPNKPKFESPIVQALLKKDWKHFGELLDAPTPTDAKLTQLIYFLDTKTLDSDSKTPFFKAVMSWVDASKFTKARESQLLSHVLGKMTLDAKEKKQVETVFVKNGWNKKRPWTQVSVSWVPMPDSTFQDIKTLLVPGRPDLTADFVHFVSKIKDEKAKKKLLALANTTKPKFAPEQQAYLTEHLKNLTAMAPPSSHREQ